MVLPLWLTLLPFLTQIVSWLSCLLAVLSLFSGPLVFIFFFIFFRPFFEALFTICTITVQPKPPHHLPVSFSDLRWIVKCFSKDSQPEILMGSPRPTYVLLFQQNFFISLCLLLHQSFLFQSISRISAIDDPDEPGHDAGDRARAATNSSYSSDTASFIVGFFFPELSLPSS